MKKVIDGTDRRQICSAGHKKHDRLIVKTDLGPMTVYNWDKYKDYKGYCTGQDDVSRTLINEGIWEKDQGKLIQKILEEGNKKSLVVDVGSHIGWYSKMASKMGYGVEAYEGNGEHIEVLGLNAPKVSQHLMWFDSKLNSLFNIDGDIELMKIDIEGAENHAIKYFMPCMNRVKNLIMEVSPIFNDSYPQLVKVINDLGLKAFEVGGEPFDFNFDFEQRDLWFKK